MKYEYFKTTSKKRLLNNVSVGHESGCWIWNGGKSKKTGYGCFTYNNKSHSAHRASWKLFNGEIKNGLCVCHKCDVRLCVNPNHLFLGTHKDNMQDCKKKGRLKSHIGVKNNSCKLDVLSVLEIARSKETSVYLSKKYNINRKMVTNIKNGYSWGHLTGIQHKKKINRFGSNAPISKLTEDQVLEIAKSVELRKITAKKYNVSKSTVQHIQLGSTWSHLTGIVYKKKWRQKKDG